ncbi:MAG: pyridoxamine kinase [Firmicutes bacterium]|nr:pyridoxamine kinase [Bacillota bacterium]
MKKQKRVLAVHDISCFGRCSLTVALPIISALGIETSVLPTAVLSTHTGGFSGFTYRDLTCDLVPVLKHWDTLNLTFDAIYSGFLGSFEQIEIVKSLIESYKKKDKDTLVIVDPVMADNGELYKVFPKSFPLGMKSLCSVADIIIPNMTEACLLTDTPYAKPPYTEEFIKTLLNKLAKIGAKKIVLTGVAFNNEELGTACYDAESGVTQYAMSKLIDGFYHGTGDCFGSALTATLVKGKSLSWAARAAVDFTVDAIVRTKDAETDIRFGVNFEEGLKDFAILCT